LDLGQGGKRGKGGKRVGSEQVEEADESVEHLSYALLLGT
jgi:hypothetical protein